MLDTVNRLNRVLTMAPTARVEKLRDRYLSTRDKAVVDMGRIITRVMKETEGEPTITRHAKALAATARETPVNIYPDELFVGWLWSEPRATEVPVTAFGLERELDTISTREYTPFEVGEDVKRELRENIFPYWRERYWRPPVPPEAARLGIKAASETRFLPHIVVNYEKVLEKGFLGIKADAEARLARLDLTNADDVKKVPFLDGVIIALEGAAELGARFAGRARELAAAEPDEARRAELHQIAENCEQVPAHPAQSFYQALQSVWFTHMILGWEVGFHGGISPGRCDQYLYPFYACDLEAGLVTRESAQELIDCWFMRYSQMFSINTEAGSRYSSNHTSAHHIGIGGMKADSSDATNDLSFMFLEAMMHTPGMVEPTIGMLVHSKTPESLLIKACQLTSLGGGYPQFINQDVLVNNLLARGNLIGGEPVTLEIARKYGGCVGCHEPNLHTMESGWNATGTNLPTIFETVIYNGYDRTGTKKLGIETGDPTAFETFEEFRGAFEKQIAFAVLRAHTAQNLGETKLIPTVFSSALTEDCIENGVSKEEGGARYSVGAISMVGSVDTGNALAGVKKLVFDDRSVTMAELRQALQDNFEGHDRVHQLCLEAPKFGNGDGYVDEQVSWVTHVYAEEVKQYRTTYDGPKLVVQVPLSSYVPAGFPVGALPSGRLAGTPLSDGVSPTQGTDMNGPTAIIHSVGAINNAEVSLGQTLNLKLDPTVFDSDDGYKRLADLLRVFVDQKLDHIQINVVSGETLRAAQREPDKYRDLVVKVAGYNARFVDLHKEIQDSIIARTEHGL